MAVGFRMIRPLDVPARDVQEKFWEVYSEHLSRDVKDRVSEGRGIYGRVDESLEKELKATGY